ncbi:MAG: hypothetical protein LBG13_02740 [Holosporales bacterium]|jgi:hypothetical protein|nr:hypothetical protein [Holosporales bacterium]
MGQKYFLHENKKACYEIIDTCSCGLSFPGKSAGLTRRVLVYVRETMMKSLEKSVQKAASPIGFVQVLLGFWPISKHITHTKSTHTLDTSARNVIQ